jgi:hypothetical protein
MTIVFDSTHTVKPSTFALGLATARPERRKPYTAADQQWWAENSPTRDFGYEVLEAGPAPICGGSPERDWDSLYAESRAMDCLEAGLIPPDAADFISRTSFIGHPA